MASEDGRLAWEACVRDCDFEHTVNLLLVDGLSRIAILIAVGGAFTELREVCGREGVWKEGCSRDSASEKTK